MRKFIILILLFFSDVSFSIDWIANYAHRKVLTVQNANVNYDLTNFPVEVNTVGNSALANCQADGDDIRFTQSNGTTLLSFEKEAWSGGGGSNVTARWFVKVPTVEDVNSTASTIYIYYEYASAVNGEDITNVWDANFVLVWHFASTSWLDSTSNNNDGTTGGGATTATGLLGNSVILDGTEDYVVIAPCPDSLKFLTGDFTVTTFIYPHEDAKNIICADELSTHGGGYAFTTEATLTTGAYIADHTNQCDNNKYALNTWIQVCVTRTGASWDMDFYFNGTFGQSFPGKYWTDNIGYTTNRPFTIGVEPRDYSGQDYDGLIDELRISNKLRALAWIKFEYYNISETDNEITWGNEESPPAGDGIPVSTFRRRM